jgi:hypothetical protein
MGRMWRERKSAPRTDDFFILWIVLLAACCFGSWCCCVCAALGAESDPTSVTDC